MDMILDSLKKDLTTTVQAEGYYNRESGEYIKGEETKISFKGALLPLSEKDLKYLEDGAYSLEDVKMYTSMVLKNNAIIKDGSMQYKIYGVRDYGIIDGDFKRYFMKRVDIIDG